MIARALAVIGLVLAALVLAVGVTLNTGAGRQFVQAQINQRAAPSLHITGLAGHFPADLKLASLTLADANGTWLSATNLELRWNPLALLSGRVDVTALDAATLSIPRPPLPGKQSSSSGSLPPLRLDLDHLAIPSLFLGAPLAGEALHLAVTGALHMADAAQGDATLAATTPDGRATYQLHAALTPQTAALTLHLREPPGGLLGHLAAPTAQAPLALDATLAGPRNAAALAFTLAAGGAALDGAGTLDLTPGHPRADVILTTPALAPYGAWVGAAVQGHAGLHVIAAQSGGRTTLALTGTVALTPAPGPYARLVGPNGTVALDAVLHGQTTTLSQLTATGAGFSLGATGSFAPAAVTLTTNADLTQVADLSPRLSGAVHLHGTLTGRPQDFAVTAQLSGAVAAPKLPTSPFTLVLAAQHLPAAPQGTLTGTGALENAPLHLDAAFAQTANGPLTVKLTTAQWRSLSAQADLALAPGAPLPTGTARFTLARLQDFAAFSPVPLSGAASGDFADIGGKTFKLDLTAQNLIAAPQLGALNGTLTAVGPPEALATRVQAHVAHLLGQPAQLAFAAVLNIPHKTVTLSAFTAIWHGLTAALQGPASLDASAGLAVHHLALGVNGGRISVDGVLSPSLNANIAVDNLPASLAGLFAPGLQASGTLFATAALGGTASAPTGKATLTASAIRFLTGPAAAVPAATLVASATATGGNAAVDATLTAGPNFALTAKGQVPEQGGAFNLHVTGRTDLRLADPFLAAEGTVARGVVVTDITLTGPATALRATGTATLTGGSVQNISSGLNLSHITATLLAAGRHLTLQSVTATAGKGTLDGTGRLDLGAPNLPVTLALTAHHATPVTSDLLTETLDGTVTLSGAVEKDLALAGQITIDQADINIPKSLPPSVANLPILYAGAPPPPPPTPAPVIALDLTLRADNQIFIRGDGLFAEFAGRVHVTGTAAEPQPEGGFKLVRGNFSLAGKTLQFTQGTVEFTGDGFVPTLDLEATSTTSTNGTATLTIGGTAAKPSFTLTSTPPLPPDEILAQLLFNQTATSLTPFQAASLAVALAQLSGVGGGANPLDSVRNALGLDELSIGSSGSGPPALQAGRYVAPGVYVGATQAANGQGTQATVDINLYKGLKLQTQTGTSAESSGNTSSVGLTYQFNY